jgi:hypothetical protein
MYKDIESKILFHKERIIKEFIKHGVYPDDKMIQEKLNSIDTSLCLLQHDKAISGQEFNTVAYNNMINMLYKDLELLYKLLYDITVKEYITLKAFTDTHLDELESMVKKYNIKAEQEANSTSLGKTIFFKHNDFNLQIKDNITVIDLGNIEVNKGSRVSCFMNANNIEPEKVIFGFKHDANQDTLYTAAYNYNQDSLVIPGELQRTSYATTIDKTQIINGPIEMNLNGNKAVENNSYIILGGKNKILVKAFDNYSSQFVMEKPTRLDMASFDNRSYIDFYVVGGNKITFRFNKKPISANFPIDDYKVTNLKHIHHFFIECDAGFSFDFELDTGDVYAIKENGIIDDSKLYFSRSVDVYDFYVEEYKTGEPDTYYAFAKVINDNDDPIDIESIYIKELVSLGGDV